LDNSNFNEDLSKEQKLAKHLDNIYPEMWSSSGFTFHRNHNDINLQHRGVDGILQKNEVKFFVDEKAQLDYINSKLPTFAFEISFIKNELWREGWLFDKSKVTDIYILVTSIIVKNGDKIENGIESLKVHGIYRNKLISHLTSIGLNKSKINSLENGIRTSNSSGRVIVPELNPETEGFLFFSSQNKVEKPINLVLRLNYLIKIGCGKMIFNG